VQDEKLLQLFERFRRDGDVQALGEVFDLAGLTLQNVARHLARDTAEAEDLVQATFLTAIEKARSFDASRPLLPWLLGILTLHARDMRRKRDRDTDPDRLARPVEVGPLDQAASTELAGAVERALATLPELYRVVLGAHLSQGLKPEQIARRIDVAPGTVRVRLHRGLKRLRKVLPAGYATGAAVALTASRGQAAVKAAVLEGGRAAVASWSSQGLLSAASVATSTGAAGGAWATKLVLPLLSILGVAGIGAWAWIGFAPEPARVDVAAVAAVDEADRVPTARPVVEPNAEATATVVERDARSTSLPPGWWLVGSLGGWSPEIGGLVRVSVRDVSGVVHASVVADPRGHWSLSLDELFADLAGAPEEILVRADHLEFVPAGIVLPLPSPPALAPDERREERADLVLERSFARVTGRVTIPEAVDASAVDVALLPFDGDRGRFADVQVESCDAAGRFVLAVTEPGEYAVVTAWPGLRPDWARVRVSSTRTEIDVDLAPSEGEELRGRARLAHGPATGGVVRAYPRGPRFVGRIRLRQGIIGWTSGGPEAAQQEGLVARNGSFRIAGLPAGPCELTWVGAGRLESLEAQTGAQERFGRAALTAEAPARDLDLVFEQWAGVLEVRSGGVTLPGARIELLDGHWERIPDERETPVDPALVGDRTDPLGRYGLLAGLAPRRLLVSKAGYEPREIAWSPKLPLVDDVHVVDLEAGPPVAQLRLALPFDSEHDDRYRVRSRPIEALEPGQRSPHDEGEPVSRIVEAAGELLVLHDLLPGRWRFEVRPTVEGGTRWYGSYARPATVDVDLRPGEIAHEELPIELGGRLRLSLTGYEGPRDKVLARLFEAGRLVDVRYYAIDPVSAEGRTTGRPYVDRVNFSAPNLRPGSYELEVAPGRGWSTQRVPVDVEAGRTTGVEIELVPGASPGE